MLSLCKYRRIPPRFDQVNLQGFDEIEYRLAAFVGVFEFFSGVAAKLPAASDEPTNEPTRTAVE